jgi:glycosyltransferase involved in cell wall biosynthesis
MCVGTPVLAIGLGAIPEIIVAGKNGFFCRDAAEIVAKIPVTLELDRAECRRYVEDNFSVEKMVNTYEKIYFNVVDTVAG